MSVMAGKCPEIDVRIALRTISTAHMSRQPKNADLLKGTIIARISPGRVLNCRRYVERLETRVEKLERVLTKLYPDSDILKEIDSFADTDAWLVEYLPRPTATSTSTSVPLVLQPRHPYEIATTVIRHVSQPVEFQVDADDFAHVVLADNMKDLHINDVDKNRFFGKSSGAMLVHAAMELKNEATGSSNDIRRPILACRRDEYWVLQP
ncbi:hypothetical protein H0H93_015156, partial [Arthromyces matolae]